MRKLKSGLLVSLECRFEEPLPKLDCVNLRCYNSMSLVIHKMKNILIILVLAFVLLSLPIVVLAVGEERNHGLSQLEGITPTLRVSKAPDKDQDDVKDQDEDEDQNGIDDQDEAENEDEDEDVDLDSDEATGHAKLVNRRSQTAREHMSDVAKKVEELLTAPDREGGIGPQIRDFAKAQKQAQSEINGDLNKLEGRSGWLEKIIGPNYQSIKNLRQQITQNQTRIRQLEQLKTKLTDPADQVLIEELILSLNEQNTALIGQIQQAEQKGSALGWFFKLLSS